ncbi:unnamed protein product [Rotaria sp. Silwood2]|nr:unnamed protein product [Rotaria sp. Silwood2]CAF2747267.1 unnamed protein product [Rotaria sp. Silwood2]CAF3009334.1 unnamed protein product [Rotaria sp. Silwood2]CAF3182690.1 unnamed protein product [Rotaria sp. Silwood2]
MASSVARQWISIPSELIGSIPRTNELLEARLRYESDLITIEDLRKIEKKAVEQTVVELDQLTGSMILTDGEQTKPSFLTYPIYDLVFERYTFDKQCFQITFSDECGAHVVQLDFTEARLSLKVDPSGRLLKDFIAINNRVLERFNVNEQKKIGVHVCPGGDLDCCHSFDIDYTLMLPDLFRLNLTNFYLQLSSEKNRIKVLKCIQKHMKPNHRIFIGVIDPINPAIETAEMVRDQILEAAQFIPIEQLGTTDDCGYSPFADDTSTSREVCYEKIKARIQGTKMAEQILNARS